MQTSLSSDGRKEGSEVIPTYFIDIRRIEAEYLKNEAEKKKMAVSVGSSLVVNSSSLPKLLFLLRTMGLYVILLLYLLKLQVLLLLHCLLDFLLLVLEIHSLMFHFYEWVSLPILPIVVLRDSRPPYRVWFKLPRMILWHHCVSPLFPCGWNSDV